MADPGLTGGRAAQVDRQGALSWRVPVREARGGELAVIAATDLQALLAVGAHFTAYYGARRRQPRAQ